MHERWSHAPTCVSAVGLVRLIDAVRVAVTAEGVGPTAPFVALEGVAATVVVGRGDGVVRDTVPLIGLELHAVRAPAHSIEGRGREAEVTAEPVGHRVTPAGQHWGRGGPGGVIGDSFSDSQLSFHVHIDCRANETSFNTTNQKTC